MNSTLQMPTTKLMKILAKMIMMTLIAAIVATQAVLVGVLKTGGGYNMIYIIIILVILLAGLIAEAISAHTIDREGEE
jgi:hypothetical protein